MAQTGGSWRPQHPLIGRLLANRFQVASFIREGGMAQVFCGLQEQEPRHVAIKIVHPELAEDSEIVSRFLREAEVAARLVHPNIVRILDVGEDGDLLYMAMELLFGEDLSAPIKQRGSFSEARAARIVMGVCEAIAYAHDQRVIHRDIKPENIMLCRDPSAPEHEIVKVLDFGIAKILDAKDVKLATDASTSVRSVLTQVGAFVGTPAYVSPEQGRAEVLDARADLYSLGVVLYELVCGRLPFTGQTTMQVIARHVQDVPPLPSSLCAIHPRLEALILRLLAKNPGDRPPTARHVAAELRELAPELSAAPIERFIAKPSLPGIDTTSTVSKLEDAPTLVDASGGNPTTRIAAPQAQDPAWVARARDAIATRGTPVAAHTAPMPVSVPLSTPRRARLDVRMDHPLIGRILQGRFRVASFVTEGGMAQIFCGIDQRSSRPVAIKLVHPDLSQDREIVNRFVREVQLAARLDHPNIVKTLCIGDDPGMLYLVMEFLFGEDLSAPIKMRGTFSEARAVQIVIDICEALHHAHQQGVIHRDIKPENVMLCRQPDAPQEEVVKVLDFGIAKVLDATPDALLLDEDPTGARSVLTRVGACVGTPAYMSPEQGDSKGVVDARSDVYSVGVLLYELLCGREPFVGETPLQILARHIHDTPQPPSQLTQIHPRLESLILFALAKKPTDRPQSARQFADELRRLQPELSSMAGVAGAALDRWQNRQPHVAAQQLSRQPAHSAAVQPHAAGPAHAPIAASATQPSVPVSPVTAPVAPKQSPAVKQTLPLHAMPIVSGLPAMAPPPAAVAPRAASVRPPLAMAPAPAPAQQAAAPLDRKQPADPRIDRLLRTVGILAVFLGLAFLAIVALAVILVVKK